MKAANRAIINVGILYGKALLTAALILLSTRWVLEALGEEDFGIYNLVGGIIAMFSFLNVAMVAATQRFLSYSIGRKHEDEVRETFRASVLLHIIIGIIVFLLFEIFGKYLMHNHLSIPVHKISDAVVVLHCLSVTAFFTITTVPYQAILNSHENMLVVAIINIFESLVKLVIAICLLRYGGNRLILYSVLIMILTFSSMIMTRWYCHAHYMEVKGNIIKIRNWALLKNMFAFAGWNFISSISSLLRNQGVAMFMNSFFGLVVNASYGIATQVNGQAQFFSRTIIRALQPQITKSEGANDRTRMIRLAMTTCKLPFLILSLAVVPLIIEMDLILDLWLKEVPDYTSTFCKLVLLITLIGQLKMGLAISIESVGKIKWYQIVCGGLHFIVLPVTYCLYKLGYNPASAFYFILVEESVVVLLTSFFSKNYAGTSLKKYYYKIVFPSIGIVLLGCILSLFVVYWIDNKLIHGLLYAITYITMVSFGSYYLVLDAWERQTIYSFMMTIKNKIKRA